MALVSILIVPARGQSSGSHHSARSWTRATATVAVVAGAPEKKQKYDFNLS